MISNLVFRLACLLHPLKGLSPSLKYLALGGFIALSATACSKFQKARTRLQGDWRYVRFERFAVDSLGNVSLISDSTYALGTFRVRKFDQSKDGFEYTSDVFNAPGGTFSLSRDGLRLYFPASGLTYYIQEIKSNRLVLIRHANTFSGPPGNYPEERRFYFEK